MKLDAESAATFRQAIARLQAAQKAEEAAAAAAKETEAANQQQQGMDHAWSVLVEALKLDEPLDGQLKRAKEKHSQEIAQKDKELAEMSKELARLRARLKSEAAEEGVPHASPATMAAAPLPPRLAGSTHQTKVNSQ